MATMKTPSRFDPRAQIDIDVRARNPLVDDYTQVAPRMASRRSSAPTLFNSGDTPPFVASGNPPAALLDLPWQLRHAAARADQAEWSRLQNEYGRGADEGAVVFALLYEPAAFDPANDEYEQRVRAWARR